MVNKPARNLWTPATSQELTRHQWNMWIVVEDPKLEDTESSAVIHWACTEFCSRCKRLTFNKVGAGLFLMKNRCHCVMFGCTHFFPTHCLCWMTSSKSVCDPWGMTKYTRCMTRSFISHIIIFRAGPSIPDVQLEVSSVTSTSCLGQDLVYLMYN